MRIPGINKQTKQVTGVYSHGSNFIIILTFVLNSVLMVSSLYSVNILNFLKKKLQN